MKVLMYGATGFIGSHIAECINKSYELVCIVRNSSNTSFLDNKKIKYMKSDFSENSLKELNTDFDVIVNAIAILNGNIHDREINEYSLLKKILASLNKNNVLYLHLGSIISYGYKLPDKEIDEGFKGIKLKDEDLISFNKDNIVDKLCNMKNIKYINIQPTSTLGLRDKKSFAARIIDNYNNGKFPLISGGNSNIPIIDTRDIGNAFKFAIDNYITIKESKLIITGYNTTWKEIKHEFDNYFKNEKKSLNIPKSLFLLLAYVCEIIGKREKLNLRMAYILSKSRWYSSKNFNKYGFKASYGLKENILHLFENK